MAKLLQFIAVNNFLISHLSRLVLIIIFDLELTIS